MVELEWLEAFEVGIKQIDDDHREILRIMQGIKAAGEKRDHEACAVLLDELLAVSQAHFEREEKSCMRLGSRRWRCTRITTPSFSSAPT